MIRACGASRPACFCQGRSTRPGHLPALICMPYSDTSLPLRFAVVVTSKAWSRSQRFQERRGSSFARTAAVLVCRLQMVAHFQSIKKEPVTRSVFRIGTRPCARFPESTHHREKCIFSLCRRTLAYPAPMACGRQQPLASDRDGPADRCDRRS